MGSINQKLDEIIAQHDATKPDRYQLIIAHGVHAYTVDIHIDNDKNLSVVLLDAANDPRMYSGITTLTEHKSVSRIDVGNGTTNRDNLQKDRESCPTFALDHAIQSQKIDLHQHIQNPSIKKTLITDKVYGIDWKDMPLEIVRNVQSREQWMDYKGAYQKNHPEASGFSYEHDMYRAEHHANSCDLVKICYLFQGNIMPSVRRSLTANAAEFAKSTSEEDLLAITQGPSDTSKLTHTALT